MNYSIRAISERFGEKSPITIAAVLLVRTGWVKQGEVRVAGGEQSWVVSAANGPFTISILSGHPTGVTVILYVRGQHGDEMRLGRGETPGEDEAVMEAAMLAAMVPAAEWLVTVEETLWKAVDGVRG